MSALESVRRSSVWPLSVKCRNTSRYQLCLATIGSLIDLYIVLAANVTEDCCLMLISYANHYRKLKAAVTLQAEVIEKAEKLKGSHSPSRISVSINNLEVKFEVKLKQ